MFVLTLLSAPRFDERLSTRLSAVRLDLTMRQAMYRCCRTSRGVVWCMGTWSCISYTLGWKGSHSQSGSELTTGHMTRSTFNNAQHLFKGVGRVATRHAQRPHMHAPMLCPVTTNHPHVTSITNSPRSRSQLCKQIYFRFGRVSPGGGRPVH